MKERIIPLERLISWTIGKAFCMLTKDEDRGRNYFELAQNMYRARKMYENEMPIANKEAIESSIESLRELYEEAFEADSL